MIRLAIAFAAGFALAFVLEVVGVFLLLRLLPIL